MSEKIHDMLESKLKEIFKDAENIEIKTRDNEIEIAVYNLPFVKTYLNMFFKNLKISTTMIKRDGNNAMLYINVSFRTHVTETTLNKALQVIKTYYEVVNSVNNY